MEQNKNQMQEDLDYLVQSDQFGRFVGLIRSLREASFAELQGASVEHIKEVVGRMTAYDGLLSYAQADKIEARMRNIPYVPIPKEMKAGTRSKKNIRGEPCPTPANQYIKNHE